MERRVYEKTDTTQLLFIPSVRALQLAATEPNIHKEATKKQEIIIYHPKKNNKIRESEYTVLSKQKAINEMGMDFYQQKFINTATEYLTPMQEGSITTEKNNRNGNIHLTKPHI